MKINKLIILFLLFTIVLNIVNGATDKGSSGDKGKLVLDTKVPEVHPDSGSEALTKSESSQSGSGSDSGIESKSIGGRRIVKCPYTAYSTPHLPYGELSPGRSDPYNCYLTIPNNSSSSVGQPLTITPCDGKCGGHAYTCSEALIEEENMGYGSYSINLYGGTASGSYILISLESPSKSSGVQNSNIFIKISVNESLAIGTYTENGNRPEINPVTIQSSIGNSWTNVTIEFTEANVGFYINGQSIINYPAMYMKTEFIKPPINYRIFYGIDSKSSGSSSSKQFPSTLMIRDFEYKVGPCLEKGQQQYFIPKPYYDYYIGNCTTRESMILYNGTMDADWDILGPTSIFPNNTDVFRIQYSISCAFNTEKNYLRFKVKKAFPVSRHNFLTFWVNGGSNGGQTLWIHLALGNRKISTLNINDYLIGGIKKDQWSKIIIPMERFQLHDDSGDQLMDGFMISPTHDQYMDRVFFDFITFTNGSRCLKTTDSLPIYKHGSLSEGFSNEQSKGNQSPDCIDYGKGKNRTMLIQIQKDTKIQINFMNGSLGVETYDAMTFKFIYVPDARYTGTKGSSIFSNQPNPMKLQICLLTEQGDTTYKCLDFSSYVGGLFPLNKWFTLSIPWIDLSVDVGAGMKIGGFILKVPDDVYDVQEHQGALYFQTIELNHFRPPQKDLEEASFAISSKSFNSVLILILTLSTIFLLL